MMKIFENKIIKTILWAIALFQIVAWFGIAFFYPQGEENPMSDITNFVVDDRENIIILEGFYSKVQVYNKQGKFITNWWSPYAAHSGTLQLGEGNTVIVKNSSGNHYFTLYGKEIENQTFEVSKNQETNLKNYKLTGFPFFPKIVKTIHNKEHIIVQQPFWMNLLKAPLPFCGLSLALWFLLIGKMAMEQEKEKRRNRQNQ